MDRDRKIDRFIQAIKEIFSGMDPRTAWPLNGAQVDAYFDVDEALDIFDRLNELRKKSDIGTIAKMMPAPDIVRLFLQHNAIIGLKVAQKLKIRHVTAEERIDFVLFLFDILEQKVKNDIFCLDGKNLLWPKDEVTEILTRTEWQEPGSAEAKRELSFLTLTADNLCYALFYDIYMCGGFSIHGPYDAVQKFGPNTILIARDYNNLCPTEVWPDFNFPYRHMKVMGIYRDLDLKINFTNHPTSPTSVGDKLIASKILLDDKPVEPKQIGEIEKIFESARALQTKKVNALDDLDKVRQGINIAYYLFRDLRKAMGDDWQPPAEIEKTITKFGRKFIDQFKFQEKPPLEHWQKLFDPRLDYY